MRRKVKELPPGPGEEEADVRVRRPKAPSRRYPVKIMYMGVALLRFRVYGTQSRRD